MTPAGGCDEAVREAGQHVRRANQAVLERVEQDWSAAQLSLVRYRRLQSSAISAVNDGLLFCFCSDGDPGTLPVRINGDIQPRRPITPGTMHVLPPGTLFESNSPPSDRPTTYLNIVFPTAVLEEFADEHRLGALAPDFDFRDPFVKLLGEQMLARMRSGEEARIYRESASRVMAANLLGALSPRKRPCASGGLADRQMRRVRDFVTDHLGEDIGLLELAAVAELSPFHFCRAFKQSTGSSPHAWITARRVERAQTLMRAHPRMGLAEIALCVGYQSQAAFGTAFKRETGATPGRWRREAGE